MRKFLTFVLVSGLMTSAAVAKPSLRNVQAVENGLFAMVVADKIRKQCPNISARLLKARSELQQLYNYARQQGFSEDEIKAYVKSDAEKDRMKAKGDAYLASKGVVKSQPETYCAAGRAEIENSSQIGALLRAR